MAPNWVSLKGDFFDTGTSPFTGHEGRGVTALLPFKNFLRKKIEINLINLTAALPLDNSNCRPSYLDGHPPPLPLPVSGEELPYIKVGDRRRLDWESKSRLSDSHLICSRQNATIFSCQNIV